MKRTNVFVIIKVISVIGSLSVAFSQEQKSISFKLASEAIISWGSVEELVFQNSQQVSRLIWNTNFVPHLGLKGELQYRGLIGSLEISTSFPIRSGNLEDFDFLLEDSNRPSQYSWHEAYLDKDMKFRASFGLRLHIGAKLAISSLAGISYENRKWSGQNGYLQYPLSGYWTGNEKLQSLAGTVISYEQALWYPFLSVVSELINSSIANVLICFSWIPYLEIHALDNHFIRDPPVQFYDQLRNGMGGEGAVKLIFPWKSQQASAAFWYIKLGVRTFSVTGTTASRIIGLGDGSFLMDPVYSAGSKEFTCFLALGLTP